MLETLSLMGAGFVHALSPLNIILMIAATALGITIGCLPVFPPRWVSPFCCRLHSVWIRPPA